MTEALIKGLLSSKIISVPEIEVSDIDSNRRKYLENKFLISTCNDNQRVASLSDVVILAVKPQVLPEVVKKIEIRENQLLISIAAGVRLSFLEKSFSGIPIVRVMPNNPALVQAGVSAISLGKRAKKKHYALAQKIFSAVGEVVEVEEKLMDAVTGLSGSGPAFIYLAIEAMIEAGKKLGMTKSISEKLAVQTVLGSAKTMLVTGKSAAELRKMVTSPGGTTIEGLKVLEKNKFKDTLIKAIIAASEKSRVLSQR